MGTQVFGHHSGEGCLSILYVELSLSPAAAAKNLDLHLVFFSRKKVLKKQAFDVETFSFGNKKANLEVGQSIL